MNDHRPPHPPHPPHPPMPPHPHARPPRDARTRWSLPLLEHPRLELATDFARLTIVPTEKGESPWLEVTPERRHDVVPPVEVDGSGGTTRVQIATAWGGDPSWWSGPWWESAFWEKRFWKKGMRVSVVAHVPPNVQGHIRSNAAKVHVYGLVGCDLAVESDAGLLSIEDVSGRLKLSTQAGRIDARRIAGAIDIESNAGAVTAEVLSLSPGTHRLRTNVGAVRLELARGMPVRIAARTTMGATRVDFPSDDDAPAVLDVEADLGAIRIVESSRRWENAPAEGGPYRSPAAAAPSPAHDEEVQRILERVADGSITPEAARDLLRALGVT